LCLLGAGGTTGSDEEGSGLRPKSQDLHVPTEGGGGASEGGEEGVNGTSEGGTEGGKKVQGEGIMGRGLMDEEGGVVDGAVVVTIG
jgi:hypothetical protein